MAALCVSPCSLTCQHSHHASLAARRPAAAAQIPDLPGVLLLRSLRYEHCLGVAGKAGQQSNLRPLKTAWTWAPYAEPMSMRLVWNSRLDDCHLIPSQLTLYCSET